MRQSANILGIFTFAIFLFSCSNSTDNFSGEWYSVKSPHRKPVKIIKFGADYKVSRYDNNNERYKELTAIESDGKLKVSEVMGESIIVYDNNTHHILFNGDEWERRDQQK
jgi:hypothetical protein